MAKRKKIIIGNWKMNPDTVDEAKKNFSRIKRKSVGKNKIVVIICPSTIYLIPLHKISGKGRLKLGVQDVFWSDGGFYTGQISAAMVSGAGAKYCIIGHSEKRKLGETNEQVSRKIASVCPLGLTAILCIGEDSRDNNGDYLAFLKDQLLASLAGVEKKYLASKLIIAYEPVWAIGRKDMQAMKPSDIHQTSIYIKKIINDAFGGDIAREVPIIYGGSVSSDNAKEVVYGGEVDGLLVGRQSLDPEAFGGILKAIEEGR